MINGLRELMKRKQFSRLIRSVICQQCESKFNHFSKIYIIVSSLGFLIEIRMMIEYRRIPIVAAPVTFGFSRPKGPLLSGSRYFRMVESR